MRTLSPSHKDLVRIEDLINKLKTAGSAGEYDLLVEHLQTACAYELGAMPVEEEHNLLMALTAADAVPDDALRNEIKKTISGIRRSAVSEPAGPRGPHVHEPPANSGAAASNLQEYFHGSQDASFGIFYPKKHVVAVFALLDQAQAARQALIARGFRIWETIAVPGAEVDKLLEEMKANRTLWDALMVEVSRLLDTEIGLVEKYGHWARAGAGFLLAYSATQEDAEEVAQILKPLNPLAMHWFTASYIQHLLPAG